jgi:hypothetical protein
MDASKAKKEASKKIAEKESGIVQHRHGPWINV